MAGHLGAVTACLTDTQKSQSVKHLSSGTPRTDKNSFGSVVLVRRSIYIYIYIYVYIYIYIYKDSGKVEQQITPEKGSVAISKLYPVVRRTVLLQAAM